MNILLTGGAGYIGSHAAATLSEAGHSVFLYDNFSNCSKTIPNNLALILGKPVIFIEGDIRNQPLLEKTLADYCIEAVMHFAGQKAVGESMNLPLEYYDNNVGGSLSLLRAMIAQNVKNLVFSSSATVYGDPQYLPIDEHHKLAPTNPYGRTKLHIEQILEDVVLADSSWKVVNLRYFNPVGAHHSALLGENPKGIPNNLMPYIAKVSTGELNQLKIFGGDYPTIDGTGVRDFIHVEDLAEGHVAALSYLPHAEGFESFNLGTGRGYSVLEVISTFESISQKNINFEMVNRRPGDIASCFASAEKAKRVLGWQSKRSLLDMCKSAWDFQVQINRSA